MARGTKHINFSLPLEVYREVDELAQQKGVSRSELIRQALRQHVASERRWQQIREWGEESTKELRIGDEKDVERLIHEFRKEQFQS